MTFIVRLFLSLSILLIMGLVYLTNGSMLFMASAFYLLILFSNKINNIWNVVYLGLYINIVILLLAILYTEGHVSYLGARIFFIFTIKFYFLRQFFGLYLYMHIHTLIEIILP